ncbi:MAG: TIGR02147 family protein [Chitinivibrionales bacterium]|nr:TIGR02147 family protein [Chitinivibrionales bacterium]MBD3394939.1 TIGR02147 family protein [Chitinivibrionales bacterium]
MPQPDPQAPVVYAYYDYRKYLRDTYEYRHAQDERFSYRFIQQKIGIDPGFLVKVFNGQKNLSESAVPAFARLLKLDKRQTEYFTYLVLFGRAKSDAAIRNYFEKLLSFTEFGAKRVDADSYEFYKHWYYSAVREIINYYPFAGNYKELAAMTVPAIKPSEAKKAMQLLERLNFVRKGRGGKYELTSQFITTGDEWRSIAVKQFQEQTIELAGTALERVPREERDISTVTVTLSKEGFEKLRDKLKDFRQEALRIAHQETNATGAYHVNFQLIPIGRHYDEGEDL